MKKKVTLTFNILLIFAVILSILVAFIPAIFIKTHTAYLVGWLIIFGQVIAIFYILRIIYKKIRKQTIPSQLKTRFILSLILLITYWVLFFSKQYGFIL